jgi:hypothetical protein
VLLAWKVTNARAILAKKKMQRQLIVQREKNLSAAMENGVLILKKVLRLWQVLLRSPISVLRINA